jgi:environmental stress-induced protein Ves
MRLLRAADYRRMPWKNGGGETIEMMVSPADASFETFDWRISMAHVDAPGAFSLFPNIDRTLSVIAGAGLSLRFAAGDVTSLDRRSMPFSFAGDIAVDSALIDGPIDDLNVMTRRDRCRHRVSQYSLNTSTQLTWQGDIGILMAIGEVADIVTDQINVALVPKDAMIFEVGDPKQCAAIPRSGTDLFLIEIWYR